MVDSGAKRALVDHGKSLLPSGIISVEGTFHRGDCVQVRDEDGAELCRGITQYDSTEIVRIKGHNSNEIQSILGFYHQDEVIHRDDLVLKMDR